MAISTEKKFLWMDQTEMNIFTRRYGIAVVMLIMIIGLSIVSPAFRSRDNIISILVQISINGIMAIGMVFVMTAGGIDLSVGSMLALTSAIVGVVLIGTNSVVLAVLISLLACMVFGFINGILVAKFKMFPFVVTLATQLVIRGCGYLVTGGYSRSFTSPKFLLIGTGKFFDVLPYPVIILLVVIVIAYILMHNTKLGRYVYAVGGNINAAIASGINVSRTQINTYIISGLCCGIAGIVMTSRINSSQPNIGVGYETDVIVACVIGGTSFAGGVATIPGTVVGIIIIGLIYNGMNLIGISTYWQTITKGLLVIGAVMLDMFMNKKRW